MSVAIIRARPTSPLISALLETSLSLQPAGEDAAAGFDHVGDGVLAAEEGPLQVYGHDPVPHLLCGVEHGADRIYPGVVH